LTASKSSENKKGQLLSWPFLLVPKGGLGLRSPDVLSVSLLRNSSRIRAHPCALILAPHWWGLEGRRSSLPLVALTRALLLPAFLPKGLFFAIRSAQKRCSSPVIIT